MCSACASNHGQFDGLCKKCVRDAPCRVVLERRLQIINQRISLRFQLTCLLRFQVLGHFLQHTQTPTNITSVRLTFCFTCPGPRPMCFCVCFMCFQITCCFAFPASKLCARRDLETIKHEKVETNYSTSRACPGSNTLVQIHVYNCTSHGTHLLCGVCVCCSVILADRDLVVGS